MCLLYDALNHEAHEEHGGRPGSRGSERRHDGGTGFDRGRPDRVGAPQAARCVARTSPFRHPPGSCTPRIAQRSGPAARSRSKPSAWEASVCFVVSVVILRLPLAPMALIFEVCVDSAEAAVAAQEGGADRVELCSDLLEGGLTPSHGTLAVARQRLRIGIMAMVRPRGGDFCYSDAEFAVMREDLRDAKRLGVNGLVFGLLNPDGTIDRDRTAELIAIARPLPVTFHRAFDVSRDPFEALDTLIDLGVDRVLTSGQEPSVARRPRPDRRPREARRRTHHRHAGRRHHRADGRPHRPGLRRDGAALRQPRAARRADGVPQPAGVHGRHAPPAGVRAGRHAVRVGRGHHRRGPRSRVSLSL